MTKFANRDRAEITNL